MSDTEVEEVEEEEFSEEEIEEIVSWNAADVKDEIAEAGPNKLAAIKAAEEADKERTSVLKAIAAREEELGVTVEAAVEPMTFEQAPIDEKVEIIHEGFWVRLANAKGVPPHLVGRDAVVVQALVRKAEGGDTISPEPYDYQDGSEVLVIRARDTGEYLSLTRDAFAAFDSDVSRLQVPA